VTAFFILVRRMVPVLLLLAAALLVYPRFPHSSWACLANVSQHGRSCSKAVTNQVAIAGVVATFAVLLIGGSKLPGDKR
jgi:hypothetical protein